MRIGIIGMGFMGGVHFNAWQSIDEANVVAVCDANPIGEQAKQGNLDAGADKLNLDGVSIYTDVAEMLAQELLDAVSITLPTHLHKTVSIQCMEADVHVLCEKPMALNLDDCDAMIKTANKTGKELMVAHCIRFWPEYQWTKNMIDGGEYGKVISADFSRLTYSPAWDADSWFSDQNKSGGIALDLHIHDLDFIQFLFGTSQNITAEKTHLNNGMIREIRTFLDYGKGYSISATASWAMPEEFGFQMGFLIVLEKATLCFDSKADVPLSLIPINSETIIPQIEQGNGYTPEIQHFAQIISNPTEEKIITPKQARESVRMALETVKS